MGEGPYRRGKEVHVEDNQIIDLYWARTETAISETAKKYGRYCHVALMGCQKKISKQITLSLVVRYINMAKTLLSKSTVHTGSM